MNICQSIRKKINLLPLHKKKESSTIEKKILYKVDSFPSSNFLRSNSWLTSDRSIFMPIKKKSINRLILLLREVIKPDLISHTEKKIFFIIPRISKYHRISTRRKQIDSRKISPIIGSYNAKVSASIELGTIVRFQFTTGYSSYEAIIFFHISYTQNVLEILSSTLLPPLPYLESEKLVSMKWYRWIKGWFVQWNDFLAQILRKRYSR